MKVSFFKIKFIYLLLILFSTLTYASNGVILDVIKKNNGSGWFIDGASDEYNLKYVNSNRVEYVNNKIIPAGIGVNNIFLDSLTDDVVSLVMNYPKDSYEFKFLSEETPRLLSACKSIILPSPGKKQAVAVLTLCLKESIIKNMTLSNADMGIFLSPENLTLERDVETLIGKDKSFLYSENRMRIKNNPYLIKGDVIKIIGYKDSMLQVEYNSKGKVKIYWIDFFDIL